ncbi:MAG TPA: hypothetical protein PLE36_14850 [Deltaproteobacteria bacterium]|jgi:hypothetical protein|nr:hypothetical protein [Deltaproteobacteria bacterium]HPV30987.1 hypothetical protein [Deltaproteobacteria bacterium]HQM21898.1 hypothetical protein [Deltaproteobacteria bacterium]HQO82055.1 hypothetical protein [Deltaproteobacteria bacterium]HRT46346.1 hypothetical protein [Desulfomonilia bacterium]
MPPAGRSAALPAALSGYSQRVIPFGVRPRADPRCNKDWTSHLACFTHVVFSCGKFAALEKKDLRPGGRFFLPPLPGVFSAMLLGNQILELYLIDLSQACHGKGFFNDTP